MARTPRPVGFDWDRLSSLLGPSHLTPPPPASITREDFAAKLGLSRTSSQDALNKLVKLGQLETGKFYNKSKGQWQRYWWQAK